MTTGNRRKGPMKFLGILSTLFFTFVSGPLFSEDAVYTAIAAALIGNFQLQEEIEEIADIFEEIDRKVEEEKHDLYTMISTVFDIVHNQYGYDKSLLLVLQELEICIPPGEVEEFKPVADEYVSALAEPCILPDLVNEGKNTTGFFDEQK